MCDEGWELSLPTFSHLYLFLVVCSLPLKSAERRRECYCSTPELTPGDSDLVGQNLLLPVLVMLVYIYRRTSGKAMLNLGLTIVQTLPRYCVPVCLHLKEVEEIRRDGRRVMMEVKGWEDMPLSIWDFL